MNKEIKQLLWFYTALLFLVLVSLSKGSENGKGTNKLQEELLILVLVFV